MDERAEVRAGLRVDDPMVIFIRCRVPQRGMRTHIRCSSIRTRSAWTRSTTWRIWARSPSTFVPEVDDQTGLLDQFVRALDLASHGDTGADRDRLDFGCRFHGP